jgi:hypothetical protein
MIVLATIMSLAIIGMCIRLGITMVKSYPTIPIKIIVTMVLLIASEALGLAVAILTSMYNYDDQFSYEGKDYDRSDY